MFDPFAEHICQNWSDRVCHRHTIGLSVHGVMRNRPMHSPHLRAAAFCGDVRITDTICVHERTISVTYSSGPRANREWISNDDLCVYQRYFAFELYPRIQMNLSYFVWRTCNRGFPHSFFIQFAVPYCRVLHKRNKIWKESICIYTWLATHTW